jgi:hypothetical protein
MNKNKLSAWIAIVITVLAAFIASGSVYLALVVAFVLAALLTPLRTMELLRDNTVDAELNINTILDAALRAFKRAVLPLSAFATAYRNVQLKGTDKMVVPYYPLVTAASKDFDKCYVFDDDYAVDKRSVTINKRKYQSWTITGRELSRLPQLQLEKIGAMYGEKLAYDVLQDIFSIITAANYGAAAFTGAASTFDSDDVTALAVVADNLLWPKTGRSMIVKPEYKGNLFLDGDVRLEYAYGDNGVIRDDVLPRVGGFDFGWTPGIPANNENLVGFIAYMSAILVGFSPIEPPPMARKMMAEYQIVTDPDSELSLEYRAWGEPGCDADLHVIECNYGYDKGETDALRRMVSA